MKSMTIKRQIQPIWGVSKILRRWMDGEISGAKAGELLGFNRHESDELLFAIWEMRRALTVIKNKTRWMQAEMLRPGGGYSVSLAELDGLEREAAGAIEAARNFPEDSETCPHCGCQLKDPFTGRRIIHDISKCSNGPGEEDGPWAKGWLERNRTTPWHDDIELEAADFVPNRLVEKLEWLEKKSRKWSTQVSAGFTEQDIEHAAMVGDASIRVVYSGHAQTIPLLSLNRREIMELIKWVQRGVKDASI